MKLTDHFDTWSLVVIALTFVLFVAALFTKGLTHDLLLEAGVFLVSVKLILMAYRTSVSNVAVERKLDGIQAAVERLCQAAPSASPSLEDRSTDPEESQCGRT